MHGEPAPAVIRLYSLNAVRGRSCTSGVVHFSEGIEFRSTATGASPKVVFAGCALAVAAAPFETGATRAAWPSAPPRIFGVTEHGDNRPETGVDSAQPC